MSRLTAKDYLRTHDRVRKLWSQDSSLFAELTPMEQWQLHDFFKPDKAWSDLELLQHRDAITKERPSLPHQAGRALAKFWETTARLGVRRVARAKAPAGNKRVKQGDRRLIAKALVHPEPDLEKLAQAYINLAYDMAKKQVADNAQSSADAPDSESVSDL